MDIGKGPSISSTPSRKLSKGISKLKGPALSGTASESVICCPKEAGDGVVIVPGAEGLELLVLSAVSALVARAAEKIDGLEPASDCCAFFSSSSSFARSFLPIHTEVEVSPLPLT